MHDAVGRRVSVGSTVGAHITVRVILPRGPVFLYCTVPLCVPPSNPRANASHHRHVIASSSSPAAAPRFWLGGSDGNGTETDRKNAVARAFLQCCLRLHLSLREISSWPSSSGCCHGGGTGEGALQGPAGFQAALANRGLGLDRDHLCLHPWTRTWYYSTCKTIKFFLVDVSVTGALLVMIS